MPANTRQLRRRIRSVKNTSQITKAMEMVAASKMRRAQMMVLSSRPYSEKMGELLSHLAAAVKSSEVPHPLLESRETRNVGLLVVTANRGLCGGLNSNAIRQAGSFILDQQNPVKIVAVGRKGRDWFVRRDQNVIAEFIQLPDRPALIDTTPISHILIDEYVRGEVDEVYAVFSQFVSTLVQKPVLKRLLPIEPAALTGARAEYIYEPSAGDVLTKLVPRYVEVQVYQAILEASASEWSARMVAMRNATENAHEMIGDLTLSLNRARQASITTEITEISAGAEALA
ncbi:MAG: ATP synthase F1 subunit gamma [Dehalococcoidales bacterium]|nr:ATP synthase F1 subunit gamma [Dehalococcoidales bacterium]